MALPSNVTLVPIVPAPPARPADGHKGTFGRVLILGGSEGMSGAACLSGLAALRGGAGLVTVGTPRPVLNAVANYEPAYLTLGFPADDTGKLVREALEPIRETFAKQDAGAIGPGLGQSDALTEIICDLYRTLEIPLVIDADGLNALASRRDCLTREANAAARILTPHPGEFARLTGRDMKTIQSSREELAVAFAAEHRVILLLKGPQTLITDGTRLAVNSTGNSGMATGGTGDVLTGLIAALLGQRMDPFDAAQFGAHLHGRAGDLAADDLSQPGLISSDLPYYIAKAWREMGK